MTPVVSLELEEIGVYKKKESDWGVANAQLHKPNTLSLNSQLM